MTDSLLRSPSPNTRLLPRARIATQRRLGLGVLSLSMLGLSVCQSHAADDRLEVRRDAREPAFAQVIYQYYQNHPYKALTTLLGDRELAFNASGTVNVLLGDLYARYGLPRESDAALSRASSRDVTAGNRNMPWLRYGKLLYQTGQDSIALNFLRKPPAMLTPLQESERVIMVANILIRQSRVDEAIESLQDYRTPSPFYRQLARYNLALALLQPPTDTLKTTESQTRLIKESERREKIASQILNDLLQGKVQTLKPIIVNQDTSSSKKSGWFGSRNKDTATLLEQRVDAIGSQLSASAVTQDVEDDSITDTDRNNLRDKIALSLAYLALTQKNPDLARQSLRQVRLDSPYSNQALLTSAHVYYQLGDFAKCYNFATELSGRNPTDPLVQEGWLLGARALEEQRKPEAAERYRQAINLFKAQTSQLDQLNRELEEMDFNRIFPVDSLDPVLLGLPSIPDSPYAGWWAQLLDQHDVLAVVQQIQQTQVLRTNLTNYGTRLNRLENRTDLNRDDRLALHETQDLYDKVRMDFDKAAGQDRVALIARIRVPLKKRQEQLDRYLLEALLGLQRVEQSKER